ncbi:MULTISPECIES: hypothetical protein [unclassified Thalassolituus]|uniref:hypothetical protein n=1 Tax=unclassified Thalassolituus TaxID=2624967 RepID=UPI0025F99BB1|nr:MULTISPECIES: hypothetical protein [unclassified Thalassolituus]|tara:strand:- start:8224 stop:9288 length:1065 start_codon:yes stop_codon:yes gene_type:complete
MLTKICRKVLFLISSVLIYNSVLAEIPSASEVVDCNRGVYYPEENEDRVTADIMNISCYLIDGVNTLQWARFSVINVESHVATLESLLNFSTANSAPDTTVAGRDSVAGYRLPTLKELMLLTEYVAPLGSTVDGQSTPVYSLFGNNYIIRYWLENGGISSPSTSYLISRTPHFSEGSVDGVFAVNIADGTTAVLPLSALTVAGTRTAYALYVRSFPAKFRLRTIQGGQTVCLSRPEVADTNGNYYPSLETCDTDDRFYWSYNIETDSRCIYSTYLGEDYCLSRFSSDLVAEAMLRPESGSGYDSFDAWSFRNNVLFHYFNPNGSGPTNGDYYFTNNLETSRTLGDALEWEVVRD